MTIVFAVPSVSRLILVNRPAAPPPSRSWLADLADALNPNCCRLAWLIMESPVAPSISSARTRPSP